MLISGVNWYVWSWETKKLMKSVNKVSGQDTKAITEENIDDGCQANLPRCMEYVLKHGSSPCMER